ncbi:MAG: hypothetical protein WDM81_11575 [Rhizomicrobium sp.]
MLPLHTFAKICGSIPHRVLKVLRLIEALDGDYSPDRVLVDTRQGPAIDRAAFDLLGFAGTLSHEPQDRCPNVSGLANDAVVRPGDVVLLSPKGKYPCAIVAAPTQIFYSRPNAATASA